MKARFRSAERTQSRRTLHGNVREAAAWALDRTLRSSAPADTYLQSAMGRCDERDLGLLHELVLGSLRWLRLLDHVISSASDRPLERIEESLRAPLRLAAYQLLFLDRVPSHAVVNEAVQQARRLTHRGGASFVNAVLRRIARSPRLKDWPVVESDSLRQLAIENSHPDFLVRRWLERLGEQATRRLLDANNQTKPIHLLAFRDLGGRELLAEELIDDGLELEPSNIAPLGLTVRLGRPWQMESFARGRFYIQDEASQLAALIPLPRAGDRILDLAAAPGGKSFALTAYEPQAHCVGADRSLKRLLTMRSNLHRLRRTFPLVVVDACQPGLGGGFDRVVVDLPCSGTGTLCRKPELRWRLTQSEIDRLASQGLAILQGAAGGVRPGGLLVVITCSIEREENEDVVSRLRAERTDFVPFDLEERVPLSAREGIRGPGFWRLLPGDGHDGFTVHVLRRD